MCVYERYLKRFLDIILSLIALLLIFPLLMFLAFLGLIAMKGNPFFWQLRPGKIDVKSGHERFFRLVKFRTMSNAKDADGNFLSDSMRLNTYGRMLRSTSLDELPELFNILVGDLSVVGPRPQLIRDMVFMTSEQRRRHSVRQGLTGLAQINGRNSITWEDKFAWDLKYVENISFLTDMKIIFATVGKVVKRADIEREGTVSDIDFGDWLLDQGKITVTEYEEGQRKAIEIIKGCDIVA